MGTKSGIKKLLSLAKKNQFPQAIKLGVRLCKSEPDNADVWSLLGSLYGQTGNYVDALNAAQQALNLQSNRLDALSNAAYASLSLGSIDNAIQYYRKAIGVAPDSAQLHNSLGYSLRIKGYYAEALAVLQKSISLQANYAEPLYNLALVYKAQGLIKSAIDSFRQALLYKPDAEAVMLELATCLQQDGCCDEALTLYNNILKVNPAHHWAQTGKASALEMSGDFDQAWNTIKPLKEWITKDTSIADVYTTCALRLNKRDEAKEVLENSLSSSAQNNNPNKERISSMNFKLGQLNEKDGEYEKAFSCYQRANELTTHNGTPDHAIEFMAHIKAFFSEDFFKTARYINNCSETIIFIIGMPRSGTSLVEQILSSHTKIHGAGESEALTDSVAIFLSPSEIHGYEFKHHKVTESARLNTATKNYLGTILKGADKNQLITDKMPHNFLRLGMLALILPEAKVIHCMRDPMDTCLSIYANSLSAAHPYANDLIKLGKHYKAYSELMDHWKSILPLQIMDIHYEKLVENSKDEISALLDFLNLPWEDACLNYHQNDRKVTTISYDQVRQPIYKSSIGRWQHFAKQLKPLQDVINET
jgi:tetratricopeptide (TPR) repeat protein